MNRPSEEIRTQISQILSSDMTQVGSVFNAQKEGIQGDNELVENQIVANRGAASNVRAIIRAIYDGEIPESSAIAAAAAGKARKYLKTAGVGESVRAYLVSVVDECTMRQTDASAQDIDEREQAQGTKDFEQVIRELNGVYVYSFSTYLRHPAKIDPERYWLKIGKADGAVWQRIKSGQGQAETHFPEDPLPCRLYRSPELEPRELEERLHKILRSSGVQAKGDHVGTEWFATTLKHLDSMADVFDLEIYRNPAVDMFGASGNF